MERPAFFEVKKWALVGVCSFYIVLEIILAGFSAKIADAWIEEYKEEKGYKNTGDIEFDRKMVMITIIVSAIIAILFQLMGILGAIKEHLCLMTTFVVLHFLGTIGSFAEALKTRAMWSEFAWSALITCIGVLYVRDLVLIRRQERNQQYA